MDDLLEERRRDDRIKLRRTGASTSVAARGGCECASETTSREVLESEKTLEGPLKGPDSQIYITGKMK